MSETLHNDSERDASLTAVYRAAAADEPPAALDAAILAAARREVGARPRPAGFVFAGPWRTSLSIAAVLVLSVSLVTLMREEAPELTAPPRAEMPAADFKLKPSAEVDADAKYQMAPAESGSARGERRSKNIGLQPPSGSPSGLGMRLPDVTAGVAQSKKDMMGKVEADAVAPADLAKRRFDAAAMADARDNKDKAATASELQRQAAKTGETRELAPAPATAPPRPEEAKPMAAPAPAAAVAGMSADRMGENKVQAKQSPARTERGEAESRMRAQEYAPAKVAAEEAAPTVAAKPVSPPPAPAMKPESRPFPAPASNQAPRVTTVPQVVAPRAKPAAPPIAIGKLERADELAPEKWLERIVELRKQGRFDEAKASLAEFRKRYPDYKLPEELRDWAKP